MGRHPAQVGSAVKPEPPRQARAVAVAAVPHSCTTVRRPTGGLASRQPPQLQAAQAILLVVHPLIEPTPEKAGRTALIELPSIHRPNETTRIRCQQHLYLTRLVRTLTSTAEGAIAGEEATRPPANAQRLGNIPDPLQACTTAPAWKATDLTSRPVVPLALRRALAKGAPSDPRSVTDPVRDATQVAVTRAAAPRVAAIA